MDMPNDIAYTGEKLSLHMDLLYYESPPGLQLLHCLRCVHVHVCLSYPELKITKDLFF